MIDARTMSIEDVACTLQVLKAVRFCACELNPRT